MTSTESSVVVSLAELMRLESDRIASEAALERRRDEERRAEQVREREAELAREVERVAEEEERRLRELQRGREEQARERSMREADLERARREAELRTLAEASASARETELSRRLARSKSSLRVVVMSGATLLALSLAGIALVGSRAERRLGEAQQAHTLALGQVEETRRAGEERARVAAQNLSSALAELERTKAELAGAVGRAREPSPVDREPRKHLPSSRPPPTRCAPCPPGDPLCGCLEPR